MAFIVSHDEICQGSCRMTVAEGVRNKTRGQERDPRQGQQKGLALGRSRAAPFVSLPERRTRGKFSLRK